MLKVSLLLLAIASVQAAEPTPFKSEEGDFFQGILRGLQYNPNYASGCLRDFDTAAQEIGSMAGQFFEIIATVDPMRAFDTIAAAQRAFDALDSAVDRCRLPDLTHTVLNLATTTGFASLAARMGTKYDYLLARWSELFSSTNTATEKGEALGKILSVVLDYNI